MPRCLRVGAFLFCSALLCPLSAHDTRELAEEMAARAQVWLSSLPEELSAQARYPFDLDARDDWHFVPKPTSGAGVRKGVSLKEMSEEQRALALVLVKAGLSERGYSQAMIVIRLEEILREIERRGIVRDPELYYLAIFGDPDAARWGWSFEGHHLSLNFTIVDGHISGTPNFYGSNPGIVEEGEHKGLQALPGEENISRVFAKSLTAAQFAKAKIPGKTPRDILSRAKRTAEHLGDVGLSTREMTDAQKMHLRKLIDVYLQRLRPSLAQESWEKIEAQGFENVRIAWAGGVEPGQKTYYRVQGPSFLLEYANTQNDANHVHAVWRDFDGDFGRDLLSEHFKGH